ncbi:MAG: hypothetical protein H6721_24645 [Sandaracinus sp.]|nr:hypothetical protein [Sandaracinus sp.]MCB9618981.1 hypothetical protein [Sandaracinus sp.]MCB9623627.1 hypothetical protein [Sandaracinus sp.]MCB9635322.1 hypothetical protein [Sandaracinus sp.]
MRWTLALFGMLTFGCVNAIGPEGPAEEFAPSDGIPSELTRAQRRERAGQIRDAAAANGIRAGWLLAGIADAETQMSHCWRELTWACQGPYSADCGGPVVAGAGDGPCSIRQGGLGMFQFDAGTFDDTLRREGNRVLSIAGNVAAAVDFVVNMTIQSRYVAGVSTRAEALAWLNGVTPDNARFTPWIQTVTHYYNGCLPSYSCYSQRFRHYRDNALGVWNEMGGATFWNATGASPEPALPSFPAIEVYWARQADGRYELRALAPEAVERVVYVVDGYTIGESTRLEGENFPTSYVFSVERNERRLEVRGYDADNRQVGLGVGLLDVTAGTGVYVKQMGEGLYEVGLERAPEGVAAISVRVDERFELTDQITRASRSERLAVRTRFSTLGERGFAITTYDTSGAVRGTLRRSFVLR